MFLIKEPLNYMNTCSKRILLDFIKRSGAITERINIKHLLNQVWADPNLYIAYTNNPYKNYNSNLGYNKYLLKYYFDDYNEILMKLRLLVAFGAASNKNHNNQIVPILDN